MPEQPKPDAGIWSHAGIQIIGYGHNYPAELVVNDPGEALRPGSVDQAVIGGIDVRSRYVTAENETLVELAAGAAQRALADAATRPEDVGLVVLSNWTDRQFVPEPAPELAMVLGMPGAFAYNTCGACTGFIHGVQQAAALLMTGGYGQTALVVSADRFSRRVRPGSKGTLIVGDAAGAAVLHTGGAPGTGLLDTVMFASGLDREVTTVRPPDGYIRSQRHLLELAVASHRRTVNVLLARNGLAMDDLDWFVPHPGTGALHRAMQEELSVPSQKFVTNYEERGNTGSASIPIMLSEMRADGRLRDGDLVMTPTVGAGWFYGGMIFRA
ncbi:3-oxoacyl-[acyl-carrier-protein] synthase III C-terminal domain-containing protein [Austwickia chelonae]|uniref:3-oxoacyl-[acyl-carrier-protein] synthase III C-terminal domain-containing protein n=1 Tax=Austwickia chelonae TaxID=100225 RepID=UPI001967725A|nr:3-oxoacyl-[acyl-carrier-protein] synthase III C-terminal domain-containing protein [Austwickia chelonae]